MKATFFTRFLLLNLSFVLFSLSANAKMYTLNGSGKWNNAEIWTPYSPAMEIIKFDTVIIDQAVVLNVDLQINGLVMVKENGSIMGNKSLVLLKDAVFVNEGHTVVKNIINHGLISNSNIIETTADVQNHGVLNNSESIISGGYLQNMGGTILGNSGQFYAGLQILNTEQGFISNSVELIYGGYNEIRDKSKEEKADLHDGLKVNVDVVETKVNLAVANTANSDIRSVRLEKSADGVNFELTDTRLTVLGQESYNFEDILSGAKSYYRVKVYLRNGKTETLPLVVVDGKHIDSIENMGLSMNTLRY